MSENVHRAADEVERLRRENGEIVRILQENDEVELEVLYMSERLRVDADTIGGDLSPRGGSPEFYFEGEWPLDGSFGGDNGGRWR